MGDAIGFYWGEVDDKVKRVLAKLREGKDYKWMRGKLMLYADRQTWIDAAVVAGVYTVDQQQTERHLKSYASRMES